MNRSVSTTKASQSQVLDQILKQSGTLLPTNDLCWVVSECSLSYRYYTAVVPKVEGEAPVRDRQIHFNFFNFFLCVPQWGHWIGYKSEAKGVWVCMCVDVWGKKGKKKKKKMGCCKKCLTSSNIDLGHWSASLSSLYVQSMKNWPCGPPENPETEVRLFFLTSAYSRTSNSHN